MLILEILNAVPCVYALKATRDIFHFYLFYTAEDILIKNKINCSDSNVNSIRSPKN
jgi:hypothetical protein